MSAAHEKTDTGAGPKDPYTAKASETAPLKEKVEELEQFMKSCKFAMMTTRIAESGLLTSRAMAIAATEHGGIDLIFHTNAESGKTDSLESDPAINIAFLDPSGQWASISGDATVTTDRELVRKHYSPALKAWLGDLGDGKHDGGPEDPRIGVIRVKTKHAAYAINNKNFISRGIELAKGVATGDTPGFTKLKEINESDAEQWRKTNA